MERPRPDLKTIFRDGARPNGIDFGDLFDSFVHRSQDGFSFNPVSGIKADNFTLGTFSATPAAGSMRFLGGEIQFYNGTEWKGVGSGFAPLASQPPSNQPDVAYRGRVGVNLGPSPITMTDDFEVGAAGTVTKGRVGNAVIGSHIGGNAGRALFFHQRVRLLATNGGSPEANYGFGQNQNGSVFINTITGQAITFSANDVSFAEFNPAGRLVLGGNTIPLTPAAPTADTLSLHVYGNAIKSQGGANWLSTSDERTKKDIQDFHDGLEKLKALRLVNFKYNGKGGTQDNVEQIGLIGQQVEAVIPYMVKRLGNAGDERFPEDMLLLDTSPLIYVVINAVRELDEKIQQLQQLKTAHNA
ncbi:tail fiber domain-containing protein [Chitinophaga sp. Mgbs1]|uniref:Tail fiber domain-containing protein n=1 Tax=Chitinophaga solisilvae TaxID=1233460 RepID=A0A3S1CUG7_9BACT|nr:tail fiber domain-containing protein [Chitinophaga solisilvae]